MTWAFVLIAVLLAALRWSPSPRELLRRRRERLEREAAAGAIRAMVACNCQGWLAFGTGNQVHERHCKLRQALEGAGLRCNAAGADEPWDAPW